jgi:hypothetical protein
MKILSIHQPNFIPWLGFFDKISSSDIFIILDNVQYPRGKSIANRNKIKGSNGSIIELVVPISKPKGTEGKVSYKSVSFAENKWSKKILRSIEMNYRKALFFDEYYSKIREIFNSVNFCEMNIEFIYFVLNELDINTNIVRLSEIESSFGKKNSLIIDLCKYFEADTYLSGTGASKYNNTSLLKESNIDLIYQSYDHPVYRQLKGEFIPNLSVLDLIFNHGTNSKKYFK